MIACLGWGSLIWSPRELPVEGGWRPDGPRLPIEFARVSADRRLTLAVNRGSPLVTVLWTELAVPKLDDAIAALASREGCAPDFIGHWSLSHASPRDETGVIASWAGARDMDAVVWTALEPGFPERRGIPLSCEEAIGHLAGLRGAERERAEEYVRKAPLQTATPYRAEIERRFGWTPI